MAEYYKNLKKAASLEIVDKNNKPFAVMPAGSALRQMLPHRTVAVLLRDKKGRGLFRYQERQQLGFSSFSLVTAGRSCEETALHLCAAEWREEKPRLLSLGTIPPCSENDGAFTSLFEMRLPYERLRRKIEHPDLHLLLDYDELRGVRANIEEVLSPLLRAALLQGRLQPR